MILVQLHAHSDASPDSKSKIRDIIRTCEKKGIDAIAITDHDVAFDMKRLRGIKTDVTVIPAIEVSTIDDSHIVGLYIEQPIRSKKHLDVIREIHKKGGIAILVHPFRRWQGYLTPLIKRTRRDIDAVLKEIDLVEVYNCKSTPKENREAYRYFKDKDIPFVAGSDAHTLNELGNALVRLDSSIEDLREGLITAERDIVIDRTSRAFDLASHYARRAGRRALAVAGIHKGSARYKKIRKRYLSAATGIKKGLRRR